MINLEYKPCTNCGSATNSVFLFEKNDDLGIDNIKIYKCKSCSTVYLGKFSDGFESELYDYYEKYTGKTKEQVFCKLTEQSYFKVLRLLNKFNSGNLILDVGCGIGSFIDAAKSKGYEAKGIELSKSAVNIAKGFSLPVMEIDFFSKEIKCSSFDIVTMFEVIEHLPEPINFIKRAEHVIKPGGLIYLTTPNYNSLDRRIMKGRWDAFNRKHLTYFTSATLINLVKKNTNLEISYIETRNISSQLIDRLMNVFTSGENKKVNENSIRQTVVNHSSLLNVKRVINYFLRFSSCGETIVVILKKPF